MAGRPKRPKGLAERVGRYRRKLARTGVKRVEVAVPARDAGLIRRIAEVLRADDADAERLRGALAALITPPADTAAELLAFFRASPFVGENVEIERDKSTGRPPEF